MTALDTQQGQRTASRVSRRRLIRASWPLHALFALFPLWWLLGISHFVFIMLAVPMAAELVRRRPLFVPAGFGVWLLFLVWVAAGVFTLWSMAPGTEPQTSVAALVPFAYRGMWYLAITIVCLYVLNLSEDELPTRRVVRLLGWMFVVCVIGGLLGLIIPQVSIPSVVELLVPVGDSGFVYSLVHPTFAAESEFLGYAQPRPTAPFAYANAWGNNLGMYLPFFVLGWMGRDAGWRRRVAPIVLLVALVPVAYSLNRGLWLGLVLAAVLYAVRLAVSGRLLALGLLGATLVVGGAVFVATPLYDTVTVRIDTPHSNERRQTVAEEVIGTTWEGSPLLGFGSTRTVEGSFTSIAGAGTEDCPQCAPPPLGTQGFMWRLIFTTGLVGTVLYLGFVLTQIVRHLREPDPLAVTCLIVIALSLVFGFVYDSLESPMYTLMIAIGLMSRRHVAELRRRWQPNDDPPGVGT